MAQNTAGIKLYYKAESGASTVPPTKPAGDANTWTAVPGIVEMPEIGGTPDSFETTTLDNLVYKTYTTGLLDVGGTLTFKANDTAEFRTAIGAVSPSSGLLGAQATAMAAGGKLWFAIDVPAPVDKYLAFQGVASALGFGGASINGLLQINLNVTPTSEPTWY